VKIPGGRPRRPNRQLTGFTIDGRPVTVEYLTKRLREHGSACILCGSQEITVAGVFIPADDQTTINLVEAGTRHTYGPVRPGKQRTITYGLCASCSANPQAVVQEIEDRIMRDLTTQQRQVALLTEHGFEYQKDEGFWVKP
jgi:hypothetical protein